MFPSPIEWVGDQEPSQRESAALLQAIETLEAHGLKAGFAAFEDFLKTHPQSAWAPSLHVNMAEYYQRKGRYSLALAHWETVWNATKESNDPAAQKIAVRSIAGWTRLLASIGEKEKVKALIDELDRRQLPQGSLSVIIDETRGGLIKMNSRPGDSFRCGSYALGHVARALRSDVGFDGPFFEVESPDNGFRMSQLLNLAETNGMPMRAVRRPVGGEIIVPSVVHWKLNHYAAIVEIKDGRYRVMDPTFGGHVWMDAETIDLEASGAFLVPKEKVPAQWGRLSDAECGRIYGKGGPNTINNNEDNNDCPTGNNDEGGEESGDMPTGETGECPCTLGGGGGGDGDGAAVAGGGGCPDCHRPNVGMPTWDVSEPYITLWLEDTPLFYHLAGGRSMNLTLKYKQRGIDKEGAIGGFGPNWECTWLEMLQSMGGSDVYTNFLAGGGLRAFNTNGAVEYKSAQQFTMVTVGGVSVPAVYAPKGSLSVYAIAQGYGVQTTNHFLTQRYDRYERVTAFNYETIGNMVRLKEVVDIDGRTNRLAYGNATFTNLITAVTNAYGQTAQFKYDSQGRLTNIVDMAGMPSSFKYDGNNNITNLATPYGQTSFQYLSGTNATYNNTERRAIVVTEASGDKQLFEYCDLGPNGWRNSYHWNRAQYADISSTGKSDPVNMPDADLELAEIKQWYHTTVSPAEAVGDTLYAKAGPGADRDWTTFEYYGQASATVMGTLKRVRNLYRPGDGTLYFDRNSQGRPTIQTIGHSDSQSESYTNTYDASGRNLLTTFGPRGERVHAYGYNEGIETLLTSETNALSEITTYAYDTNTMKLTSITFPSGRVRSNFYYSSGANKGFLHQQIDVGFRTNFFGYANGNLVAQTNELGLVTTHLYDGLNRLVSTAYPDGTTISNVYSKLDLVAVKDRLNQWSYFGYNALRQRIAETNASGQITEYAYCACGGPSQITRWNGGTSLITTMSYDIAGRLTNATYADGFQLRYTYDTSDRVSTITDSGGYQRTRTYVQMGLEDKLASETMNSNALLSQLYDEYGRLKSRTDRNSVTTTNGYDVLHRVASRRSSGGGVLTGLETFAYDTRGLSSYTDALGKVTTYSRDTMGRVLFETNANAEILRFTYDAAGNLLTLADGKTNTTTWHYDEYGLATNKVDAAGSVIFVYKYDPNNRLTNRWTPAKGNTVYKYDPAGNLTNVTYASSGTVVFGYDGVNRLTNMVDGIGTTKFTWTDGGLLASEDGPWTNDTVSFTYVDRLRSALTLAQPSLGWTQSYAYNEYQLLTNITSPAGKFVYGYDTVPSDRPSALTLPSTSYIQYTYDGLMRVTGTYLINSGSTTLNAHQYTYNEGSQRTNETRTDSSTVAYRYDNIGQLKLADSSVAAEDRGYLYDAAWNLSKRTNNGVVGSFAVDSKNQLTSDPTYTELYDGNGNLTSRGSGGNLRLVFGYDDENRLIQWFSYALSSSQPQSGDKRTDLSYDGMGRLRRRVEYTYQNQIEAPAPWVAQSTTLYIYDGKRVIQERDTNNVPKVSYTRGNDLSGTLEGAGGIGGLLARSGSYSSGNWTNHAFYHADGNGNITCLANTNQTVVASYRYDPFGKTISQSGSLADANVYRFSLKEFHAVSGMYYYLYRFYDPNLQRWLNRDPIGEEGGINLYGFVGNDPVSWIDLFGFDRASCLNDCFNQLADCLSARNAILGTGVSTVGGGIIAGGHQTAGGAQKWLCRAGRATSYGRGLAFGTGVGFIIGATPWVVDCYSSYFGCRSGCPDPPKCPSSPPAPAGPPGPPNCNQNAPPSRLSFPL